MDVQFKTDFADDKLEDDEDEDYDTLGRAETFWGEGGTYTNTIGGHKLQPEDTALWTIYDAVSTTEFVFVKREVRKKRRAEFRFPWASQLPLRSGSRRGLAPLRMRGTHQVLGKSNPHIRSRDQCRVYVTVRERAVLGPIHKINSTARCWGRNVLTMRTSKRGEIVHEYLST